MNNPEHFKQKLLALKDELTRRVNAINKDIKHEELSSNWTEKQLNEKMMKYSNLWEMLLNKS